MPEFELKSIYKRGAENGLPFGIVMSVMAICLFYGAQSPLLMLLSFILLLSLPGLAYVYLRRCYVQEAGTSSFSSLWMLGILLFLYGSLICGVTTYICLQYLKPGFIYEQANFALHTYQSMPELKNSEITKMLSMAIQQKMLPTPIQFVFNMIWVTTFIGSLISIFISGMVRMWKVK